MVVLGKIEKGKMRVFAYLCKECGKAVKLSDQEPSECCEECSKKKKMEKTRSF